MELLKTLSPLIPHSCFPNSAVNQANELVALKIIYPGVPLTIDYSTLFVGSTPAMKCTCGFNGCRRKILGFNYLPVYFQDFYLKRDAVSGIVLASLNLKIPFYVLPGEHRPGKLS